MSASLPLVSVVLEEEEPEAPKVSCDAGTRWLRRFFAVSSLLLVIAVLAKTEAGAAFIQQARAELPARAEASLGVATDYLDATRAWWSRSAPLRLP